MTLSKVILQIWILNEVILSKVKNMRIVIQNLYMRDHRVENTITYSCKIQ